MIYTVADRDDTERKFADKLATGGRVMKVGLCAVGRNRTRGGAVWRTYADVTTWLEETRRTFQQRADADPANAANQEALRGVAALTVYGVEAEWERDTIRYDDEPFERLVIDRPMVRV